MQFSANETVQAICRTLFHSLWQGVLLAIAGGLVVMFTKKLRAAVRYNILTMLLVVFVAGAVCTFCYQLNSFAAKPAVIETIQAAAPLKITGSIQAFQATAVDVKPVTIKSVFVSWLTANAGIIVLAWLLVIAFRCVQMLVGLRGVYILRHKGLTGAGDYWVGRLTELAASIQLSKSVKLMQSAIAKVPMVTGHLKPIILLPLGVLTALPQDEIEAILLHELAHIRRKDYLVNMLQNVCEIIFFFNPAVLWVSSLIKDERENCCDDIAIGEVKNKKQFIHALISFQEYNLAASNYAVGFPGRKDHLLNRVKRIITNNNKSLTNMEKTFLATGIVILSFITIAFAHNKQVHNRPKETKNAQKETVQTKQDSVVEAVEPPAPPPAVTQDNPVIDDTTKTKKEINISSISSNSTNGHETFTMNTEFDGRTYKIVQKDGKLTALYVDGERVPDDKLDSYKPVLDSIKAAMKEQQLKQFAQQKIQINEQQEQFKKQEDQFAKQQKLYELQKEQLLKLSDANANAQYKQQIQQQVQQYKDQQEHYREQQRQYEKQFEDQQAQVVRQEDEYKRRIEANDEFILAPIPPLPPIAPIGPIAPIAPIPPMEPFTPVAPVPPIAPVAPVPPVPPVPPTDNKTVNAIISELEDENIITDEDNVSFSLNNSELIVNGVKQPDALQVRLKKEYFKSATDYIKYKSKKHNGGKEISTDISIESN